MSKFIGVKMVEAVPMTDQTAKSKGYKVSTNHYYTNNNGQDKNFIDYDFKEGYEVTYPDGYKSWCPKDVFESSYYSIQDSNGEMLYRNDVEGFIDKVESVKIGTKTTNVTITCLTGFEINAQSSCVKPENYNKEIGEQIAKPKAMDIIWGHLGFVLQWARNGLNKTNKDEAYITRMLAEQEALGDKITKLNMFITNSPIFNNLSETKRTLIIKLLTAMDEYFHILEELIKEESVSK